MSRGNWVQRNERERATTIRGRNCVPGPVRRAFIMKRTGFGGPSCQPLRTVRQFSQPNFKELFSKFGKLKRCKLHYDRTGQPRTDHFMARKIRIVGDTIQIPQRTVVRPHNFSGDARFLNRDSVRLYRGDMQPEWMRRNGHIHYQCWGQEIFDISEDESGTEFENLRVEAKYF